MFRKSESLIDEKEKEGLVKKREEWIKNWVSRKYNKPKFPRVSFTSSGLNSQV